jgi:hypothetical protein
MSDWRIDGMLLLDRRLAASPHLHTTANPGGDYEIRCSKCGQVETYSGAGDKEIDALTFALHVTGKHKHDTPDELHPTFQKFLEDALDAKHPANERREIVAREIQLTEIANEHLRQTGDTPGLKFGEKYLFVLRKIHASGNLPKP